MNAKEEIDIEALREQEPLAPDAFKGKTVIVRGASAASSAGHAIARAFAQHGANLVLTCGSRSKLRAAIALGEEFGVEAMGVHCPLADVEAVRPAIDGAMERFGRIDVLVNAAMLANPRLLKDLSAQDLERTLKVCEVIPFAWMRACLPHLSASRGSIISLGSRFAEEGLECLGALAAATQGFAALNAIAAKEWQELGITTNIVQAAACNASFRACEEEFADRLSPKAEALVADALDDTYDELAQLCLYLASEEGHDISGRVLRV